MTLRLEPTKHRVRTMADLLHTFHAGEKPREEWRIGAEWERFGVLMPEGKPVPFSGPRSIETLFHALVHDFGWKPESETEDGPTISLSKGHAALTLEPGAQLELSGAPHRNVRDVCGEMSTYQAEIQTVSDGLKIQWLALGHHPWAKREDMPSVPKIRYPIMRKYLPTRGSMALDMMLRTCTVQASIDFANEADAMRKLRLGLCLQPLCTAILANSPWVEGKSTHNLGNRARVWLNMDPDRSGLLPFAFSKEARYEDYAEWALDVPMFLVKREGRVIENTGQTFRSFMENGALGAYPTKDDWETHLRTLFPEVRLKSTLELRGLDSLPWSLACSVPALFKGLLYDDSALDQVEALTEGWSFEKLSSLRPKIAERGAHASFAGESLWSHAEKVVSIAKAGLEKLAHQTPPSETSFLEPLEKLVEQRKTPADQLLSAHNTRTPLQESLLRSKT